MMYDSGKCVTRVQEGARGIKRSINIYFVNRRIYRFPKLGNFFPQRPFDMTKIRIQRTSIYPPRIFRKEVAL